jgi:YggT family protein
MNVFSNVGSFLVDTVFTLYIVIIMIRVLLGVSRADFYNQFSQFIVTVTNPVLIPLRRIIPSFGKIDSAAILLMLTLKIIQIAVLLLLQGGAAGFLPILAAAIQKLLELLIYVYIFSIIIQAVMSWINPGALSGQNPLGSILHSLNRPLVEPVSRILPRSGVIDFSPLVVLLLLQVALIVVRSF